MKLFCTLIISLLFSTLSHAAFVSVATTQRPFLIKKVQTSLMKEMQNSRYENCMMPYDHGFGVLFRDEGSLYSRDFFFTSRDAELLDLPAYYDAELNTILLQQTWRFNSTYSLIVAYNEDDTVKNVEMKFAFKGNPEFSVQCKIKE